MFEALLGSQAAEKVLVFINARDGGYGREISEFSGTSLAPVQKQLAKFEQANILYSELKGRTRIYRLNPRYALYKELVQILNKMAECYPPEIREQLLMNRRRPRRAGKPL